VQKIISKKIHITSCTHFTVRKRNLRQPGIRFRNLRQPGIRFRNLRQPGIRFRNL